MVKLASKEERENIKKNPAVQAEVRKIGWIVGVAIAALAISWGVVRIYAPGFFFGFKEGLQASQQTEKTPASSVSHDLVKAEAELAKMPAMDGPKTLFPENVEYLYEKDGSKVTLYRELCELANGLGYAMSKSELVKDLKDMTPRNLTFEGPNGKTKGCWIDASEANWAAIATTHDPQVSIVNLREFQKNGPAPKPVGWENRQAVLEVIRREKAPRIFGSTANLKKEKGYYVEAVTDGNGIPDTTVGHAEWYLFDFNPEDGSCAEGNPKFAYALEQKHRQSFASAQHGTLHTLLRPSEGADYISYESSSVCYFFQGDEILIVGAYKPVRISADAFKKKAALNGKAL